MYVGRGAAVGGVVAFFLVRFRAPAGGTDPWLWVVVGDLPSAYFVVDEGSDPVEALEAYCEPMEAWTEAVLASRPLDDVFAVAAQPTEANARALLRRLAFLRAEVIPAWKARLPDP